MFIFYLLWYLWNIRTFHTWNNQNCSTKEGGDYLTLISSNSGETRSIESEDKFKDIRLTPNEPNHQMLFNDRKFRLKVVQMVNNYWDQTKIGRISKSLQDNYLFGRRERPLQHWLDDYMIFNSRKRRDVRSLVMGNHGVFLVCMKILLLCELI